MRMVMAKKDGRVFAGGLRVADGFFSKFIGLLRHKDISPGEGLVLTGCKQVHTFGMRFPIDVLFVSKNGELVHIEHAMLRGRVSRYIKDAAAAIELMAGSAVENEVRCGDRIILVDSGVKTDGRTA